MYKWNYIILNSVVSLVDSYYFVFQSLTPYGNSKNPVSWLQRVRVRDLRFENMSYSLCTAESEAKKLSETDMRRREEIERRNHIWITFSSFILRLYTNSLLVFQENTVLLGWFSSVFKLAQNVLFGEGACNRKHLNECIIPAQFWCELFYFFPIKNLDVNF